MLPQNLLDIFSPTHLLGVGILVVLVVAHYQLAKRYRWAGIVLPVVFTVFWGWLVYRSGEVGWRDIVILLVALVLLLSYWAKAREAANHGADDSKL